MAELRIDPQQLPTGAREAGDRPITASDLMNPDVLTVRDDMTVPELASFLWENEISGAPVEDRNGRLVGVVSLVDIAGAASQKGALGASARDYYGRSAASRPEEGGKIEEAGASPTVADIMTPTLFSVREDAPVSEIAELMLYQHLHRVLVLRGEVAVGVVSTSDLLGLLVGE